MHVKTMAQNPEIMYIGRMTDVADMHDILENIVYAGMELDEAAEALRTRGEVNLADKFKRLLLDAGIDYMRLKTSGFEAESGQQTAEIAQGYVPVTLERLEIFNEIHRIIPRDESINELCVQLKVLKNLASMIPAAAPKPIAP